MMLQSLPGCALMDSTKIKLDRLLVFCALRIKLVLILGRHQQLVLLAGTRQKEFLTVSLFHSACSTQMEASGVLLAPCGSPESSMVMVIT